jgi:transcriptional regulator with XRE-family HTH domain
MTRPRATQEDVRRRLATNVRAARKAAGLTLKVVAERAEIHWRHWQKVEAATVNITLQTLVRIGESLDIDPADLIREPSTGTGAKKKKR